MIEFVAGFICGVVALYVAAILMAATEEEEE